MAKFYSARSKTIPPLPWQTFALPFSVLLAAGLSVRLSDTSDFSILPLYPVAAALLAWRFGFWGAVTALAAIVPMAWQTGIAVDTLFGGAEIGMILTVLVLVRMVAERAYAARLLAIDTITPAQYGVATLILLPVVGYQLPEIAARIEAAPEIFYWFALFVIGLSRVGLRGPALFVILANIAQYGLALVLPVTPESGVYAGFRSVGLVGILNGCLWSLVVLAIGRALRGRFIGDLGPDARGHDGAVMVAMTRVFGTPAALWAIAFWSAILFKIGVGSEVVNPGSVGLLAAFAVGMCQWDRATARETHPRTLLSIVWTAAIWWVAFLAAALTFGAFVPLDSTFLLTADGPSLRAGMSPVGWQAMVTAYIVFGYVVAHLSLGLRRTVGHPDLWVPLQQPVRDEERHASAA